MMMVVVMVVVMMVVKASRLGSMNEFVFVTLTVAAVNNFKTFHVLLLSNFNRQPFFSRKIHISAAFL